MCGGHSSPEGGTLIVLRIYKTIRCQMLEKRHITFHSVWPQTQDRDITAHIFPMKNILGIYIYVYIYISDVYRKFLKVADWTVHFSFSFFFSPDCSVVIVTDYGLDDPRIEFRWRRDFPYLSIPNLGPTQSSIQWVLGLFLGDKAAGALRESPTPSSVEVKEWVELYLYSPSGPLWSVLGRIYLPYENVWKISPSHQTSIPGLFSPLWVATPTTASRPTHDLWIMI